ncbi:DUF3261 domain-containing protein [Thalassotalea piscium]
MSFLKLTLAILLLLTACTHSTLSTSVDVEISPQAHLLLELPRKALWDTELSQQMEIRYKDKVHQLVLLTGFNEKNIAVVALTPSGIPLFELTFTEDKQIKVTKHIPIESLSPEYVLADLQLVYWPIEQLNKQLSEGISISENEKGERLITQDKQPIIHIKKNEGNISYHHLIRHYQFTVSDIG